MILFNKKQNHNNMVEGQPHNIFVGKCHLCVEYKEDTSDKTLGLLKKKNELNLFEVEHEDVCRECFEWANEGRYQYVWIPNTPTRRIIIRREESRLREIVGGERIIIRNRE